MYLSPYSKHDEELVDLLATCVDDLLPEVQKDYLINVLTAPANKNKTLVEILKSEVQAKIDLEKQIGKKKQV